MSAPDDSAVDSQTIAKKTATLRARLCLAGGFELVELPRDGFIVKRWNWTQHCATVTDLEQFVERVESMR